MARSRGGVLRAIPSNAVGAEIGVFRGRFSKLLLRKTTPKKLYLIDPWGNQDDPGLDKSWYGKNDKNDMEAMYHMVLERFSEEAKTGQVEIIRSRSIDAASAIPDGSLDFVYIDGDHRYEGVSVDLEISYGKTKPGSLIVLDDHHLGGWWGNGVVRAASEFLGKHANEVYVYECGNGQLLLKRY